MGSAPRRRSSLRSPCNSCRRSPCRASRRSRARSDTDSEKLAHSRWGYRRSPSSRRSSDVAFLLLGAGDSFRSCSVHRSPGTATLILAHRRMAGVAGGGCRAHDPPESRASRSGVAGQSRCGTSLTVLFVAVLAWRDGLSRGRMGCRGGRVRYVAHRGVGFAP